MNPLQRQQADRFGVEIIKIRDWRIEALPIFQGPVHLSLDLNILDPAYAPGLSHHEPGGMSSRDVLTIVQELDAPLIGADIVAYNPIGDPGRYDGNAGGQIRQGNSGQTSAGEQVGFVLKF